MTLSFKFFYGPTEIVGVDSGNALFPVDHTPGEGEKIEISRFFCFFTSHHWELREIGDHLGFWSFRLDYPSLPSHCSAILRATKDRVSQHPGYPRMTSSHPGIFFCTPPWPRGLVIRNSYKNFFGLTETFKS